MSHAYGAVRFKDGTIKHYEYNGTADVILSQLYDTPEEVSYNWRSGESSQCVCGGEEEVEVYTSYGYGRIYKGRACKRCMSVRGFYDNEGCLLYEIWKGTKNRQKPKWLKEAK